MCDCQWRDIETAPKDGTLVRLKRVYEGHVIAEGGGYFGAVTIQYPASDGGPVTYGDQWIASDNRHFFPAPTHWRPSPSAAGVLVRPVDRLQALAQEAAAETEGSGYVLVAATDAGSLYGSAIRTRKTRRLDENWQKSGRVIGTRFRLHDLEWEITGVSRSHRTIYFRSLIYDKPLDILRRIRPTEMLSLYRCGALIFQASRTGRNHGTTQEFCARRQVGQRSV